MARNTTIKAIASSRAARRTNCASVRFFSFLMSSAFAKPAVVEWGLPVRSGRASSSAARPESIGCLVVRCAVSQIKRRMTDAWGDRSTLERTIQHVLRSVCQWGLLRDGPVKGSLIAAPRRIPVSDETSELLFHAILLSHGSGLPLAQSSLRCFHSTLA
jgi:hypothetical protein